MLLDVGLYEEHVDEVAHLRDLAAAETQLAAGTVVPHEEVVARLREQLTKWLQPPVTG